MLIYALFIDCRESHLSTFCRQIHQCANIGGRGGGVKPILAMPGFWQRLTLKPSLYAQVSSSLVAWVGQLGEKVETAGETGTNVIFLVSEYLTFNRSG